MKLKSLKYSGFRCLKGEADRAGVFEPSGGVNVIYGSNAQGKTSLLEAIWMFTGQRSFRAARDSALISDGGGQAKLWLDFETSSRSHTAELGINGRREAALNGVPLESASGLMGTFCASVFCPDHLNLVKQGPEERRKFIDSALGEMRPAYAENLRQYGRLLQQRRALLEMPSPDDALLSVYEEQIARRGAAVMDFRHRYIERIRPLCRQYYSDLSDGAEQMDIEYVPACGIDMSESPAREQISEALIAEFEAARAEDAKNHKASKGPTRDELNITIDGRNVRQYGSQGQQRSAVLCLKLAEAAVIAGVLGEQPVILLDDVLSELDSKRQNFVLSHLSSGQIFITCTDVEHLSGLENAALFKMEGGVIAAK